MFARHGLVFTGEIGNVFKKKSWYKPDTTKRGKYMTEAEAKASGYHPAGG